ncbi:hypothetical protein Daus18300_012728 [Diaporthe australafricana]|uniref:DUF7025 domain-containing protein n=1 Tax=Diaporthe australafricana TaxID=127596 RepID=A0ABR3W1R9_9PEZI
MSTSFELHEIYTQHFDSLAPVRASSAEQHIVHDIIENGANANVANPEHSAIEADEGSRGNLYFQREVKHVIQYPQDKLSEEVFVVSEDSYRRRRMIEEPNRPFKEFSILLRKVLNKYGRLMDIYLELQSKGLCELVQRIGRPVRGLVNLDVCPIIFQKPFRALLFLTKPLRDFLKSTTTDVRLKEEVESLLKFIHSPDGIQTSLSAYDEQIEIGRVTFSLLWALYPAETRVYFNNSVFEECGVVESTEYIYIDKTFENLLRVKVLRGHHSGKQFGVIRTHYDIPSFPGYFDINTENLPIVPLVSLPAERRSAIRKRLVKRGKRFCDLQSATMNHFAYDGPFWKSANQPLDIKRPTYRPPPKEADNPNPNQQVEVKGRVIIDSGALLSLDVQYSSDLVAPSLERFFRQNAAPDPDEKVEDGSSIGSSSVSISGEQNLEELFNFNPEDSVEITEDEYLICRPDIRGFFLNEQLWGAFLVGNLKNIDWSGNAFDHLQMKQSDKRMIERLVTGFDPSQSIDFDDTIRGKGKGLVFLLHGEPGLGKTMTAGKKHRIFDDLVNEKKEKEKKKGTLITERVLI